MRRISRLRSSVALYIALASMAVTPSAARAQQQRGVPPSTAEANANDARALFEQGLAAADGERWGDAVLFFQRSLALVERPSTQINLGNALVRSGRAVEASELLTAYLASAGSRNDPTREAQARAMLAEAQRSVVTLVVRVSGAGSGADVVLTIDGHASTGTSNGPGERTLPVNPGAHTIVARRASDGAEAQQTVNLLPGARAVLELTLRASVAAATRPAVLTFLGAPVDAEVLVDGEPRGGTQGRIEVTPGEHRVDLRAHGFAPSTQRVTLAAGEERRLLVALAPARQGEEPRPARSVFASPVFWGVVGGVLVAGGVATAVGVLASQPGPQPPPYQGTFGTTLQGLTRGF